MQHHQMIQFVFRVS